MAKKGRGKSGSFGRAIVALPGSVARGVGSAFMSIIRRGKQRFTVMLIPHSEHKVTNFQINAATLAFLVLLFGGMVIAFFYLSTLFTGTSRKANEASEELQQAQANLSAVLNEVSDVMQAAEGFDATLQRTMRGLELSGSVGSNSESVSSDGDLASFLNLEQVSSGELEEVRELERLSSMLEGAIEPLSNIRSVLSSQRQLLASIPNYWPVIGGRGRVTMEFGPNIHPVTNEWYLHKGIDIADSVGVPIVAAANGKVTELGVEPDFGVYVWIRHKYGFRTRYSHLQTVEVAEGEEVVQGSRIGTLGDTGLSTGPHLDFQVWLGTDVVDPAAFLKISNEFQRARSGR